MNQKISDIEMVVGVFQIVAGGILCYSLCEIIKTVLNTPKLHLSIGWYFNTFHTSILLSIMMIFSGVLLLLSIRLGWILGLISAFSILVTQTYPIIKSIITAVELDNVKTWNVLFFFILLMIAFDCIFLLSGKIRRKYQPLNSTWIVMLIISGLLIIDSFEII